MPGQVIDETKLSVAPDFNNTEPMPKGGNVVSPVKMSHEGRMSSDHGKKMPRDGMIKTPVAQKGVDTMGAINRRLMKG